MMSLKGIPLDPFILAQIHVHPLIPETGTEGSGETTPVRFLGENGKNILVLVRDETAAFLAEDSFGFLASVLSACKLSVADIALVNLYHYPDASFAGLVTQFNARTGILFGTLPLRGSLSERDYGIREVEGVRILSADGLELIRSDKSLKARLWSSLQKLFNLS